MNLTDVPKDAFDVQLKGGIIVHYKHRITVKAKSRHECLQQIQQLQNGRLEHLPAQIGTIWQATFVQAVNYEPPTTGKKNLETIRRLTPSE